VFQELGNVDRLPKIAGFGLILTGPDLDHGPNVANRDGHPPMLDLRAGAVKLEDIVLEQPFNDQFPPPSPGSGWSEPSPAPLPYGPNLPRCTAYTPAKFDAGDDLLVVLACLLFGRRSGFGW
jgi:hypothetical protein